MSPWGQTQNFGCSTDTSALPLITDIVNQAGQCRGSVYSKNYVQAKLSFDFVFVVADATRRAHTWRPQSHYDNAKNSFWRLCANCVGPSPSHHERTSAG